MWLADILTRQEDYVNKENYNHISQSAFQMKGSVANAQNDSSPKYRRVCVEGAAGSVPTPWRGVVYGIVGVSERLGARLQYTLVRRTVNV